MQDLVDGLRGDRVGDLAEGAELGVDLLGLGPDRLADQVGGLVRRDRRERVVDLRRRDHRRPDERHVDRREGDVVADRLAEHDARPGVERRLGGDVGAEARRVGLHADRADVDDVAGLALASCAAAGP